MIANPRARRRPGPRAAALLAAFLGILPLLAGCVSVPTSSSPQVVSSNVVEPVEQTLVPPTPGREPDLLVRDFIRSGGVPFPRHAEARQYLTPEMNERWEDVGVTVVQGVDVVSTGRSSEDAASFTVKATKVGVLADGGIFTPGGGSVSYPVVLKRIAGEWRIDQVPGGVVIEKGSLTQNYESRNLYFLSPSRDRLVPDPRWVASRGGQVSASLIALLTTGPREAYRGAVATRIPPTASLRRLERGADGTVEVDFIGIDLPDKAAMREFAAQVTWTLAAADEKGPFRILVNGEPIDDRSDGWVPAEFAPMSGAPSAELEAALIAIVGGSLVRVGATGGKALPARIPGDGRLTSAARSRDGSALAVVHDVDGGGSALEVVWNDGRSRRLTEAGRIARPTWSADGDSVWTVVDGRGIVAFTVGPDSAERIPIDDSGIRNGRDSIGEVTLSSDGVLAAVIVDGRPSIATVIADGSGYRLARAVSIAGIVGESATTIDWRGDDWVLIGTSSADRPVVESSVDGATVHTLPALGVTVPVRTVVGTSRVRYAADSRTLLQFEVGPTTDDIHWREVPGVHGARATPVGIG